MTKIVMYTSGFCGYCFAAKNLLASKGLEYEEIRVDRDPGQREEMIRISGRQTVPQIMIGDLHVGGYDDLLALERAAKLDKLLAEQGIS
jgi:glutaredoxin 3